MEQILITGATGLLGSSLVPYLKNRGYDLVTHAQSSRADFMFDLSDRVRSYEMLEHIKPSLIINLVSLTSVELCEERVKLAYLANTRTVENLVYWIGNSEENCHLIHISTDHIYDGDGLHKEDDVTITNNYALTKYAGELAANLVPSTILRTNFVGRSMVSHRESLTDWVYKSLLAKQQVEVLSDVYFSPLSITLLLDMIELTLKKRITGIYNLGSRGGMSKADFDFAFAKSLNLQTDTMTPIQTEAAEFLKAYRPRNMCMDSSKFEKEFDVQLPQLADLIETLGIDYR